MRIRFSPISIELSAAAIVAICAIIAARRAPGLWAASMIAAMALAGCARYVALHPIAPAGIRAPVRRIALWLRIDQVAPPKPGRARFASGVGTIERVDPPASGLLGRSVYYSVTLKRSASAPTRSAIERVVGLLVPVSERPAPLSFDAYLSGLGLEFRLAQGRLLGESRPPNLYRRRCERLAERMYSLLGAGLARHSDLAGIYRAMMLGRKGDLVPAQRTVFLRTGTMHLFAINGLHVGVIALALHAVFALARFPRPAAAAAVLAALWLDVDTTGDSPSAVRAFVMIAVFEAAAALGRPANALAALAASALAALLWRPAEVCSASFEMSYGVVTGIVTLGIPLAERMRSDSRAWNHLAGMLGVGIAASLVGSITGIQFFGLVAPIGILANLAVAPLAALAITAGFGAILVGLPGAASAVRLCNLAAGTLISIIAAILRLVLRLPFGSFSASFRTPWVGPCALCLFLAACLAGYALGWRRARGGFWPPCVVVAIVLAFAVSYGR